MTEPVRALVEVTNTLRVPYVTGIQRIVRQLLEHWPDDAGVQLEPVVHTGRRFRTLAEGEAAVLASEPSGPPPDTGIRGGWRSAARKVPGLRAARDGALRGRALVDEQRMRDRWVEPGSSDLLFELEATWWSPADRQLLLPELRGRGVRVATLFYDLMPLRNPEWFDPANLAAFRPWAEAQLASTDLALCYSAFCAGEIAAFGAPEPPPIERFTPGADGAGRRSAATPVPPAALAKVTAPFSLTVGTIEPRKNIGLVVDAFERLWTDGVDACLVLVGRKGWDVDALVRRLEHHPERGRRLHWLGWCSDAELDWMYANAAVVAVPSWCEGYGLPVVEAEARGASVLSSTGGSLLEVGGSRTTYLAPDDLAGWTGALRTALSGEQPGAGSTSESTGPSPAARATWAGAAAEVAAHLGALARRP